MRQPSIFNLPLKLAPAEKQEGTDETIMTEFSLRHDESTRSLMTQAEEKQTRALKKIINLKRLASAVEAETME